MIGEICKRTCTAIERIIFGCLHQDFWEGQAAKTLYISPLKQFILAVSYNNYRYQWDTYLMFWPNLQFQTIIRLLI